MRNMDICPCCHHGTSAGKKAQDRHWSVVADLAACARRHGDGRAMIQAAQHHLADVMTGVSRSPGEHLLAYDHQVWHLAEAGKLLLEAAEIHKNEAIKEVERS